MTEHEQEGGPPSLLLGALEPLRATAEFVSLLPASPILASAPRGDGSHVLVLPGFMASDASTVPLRRYLHNRGHRTSGWGLGRNLGFTAIGPLLRDLLARANDRAGGPVSLVGWSLGGVMARRLARNHPTAVTRLVTLGSPIGGSPSRTSVGRVYDRVEPGRRAEVDARYRDDGVLVPPTGVPSTAIYSRTDGVVPWQIAREQPGPLTENIEVRASHIGLGVNPGVLYAVADRLAQKPDPWRRFRAPALLRGVIDHGRTADRGPSARKD